MAGGLTGLINPSGWGQSDKDIYGSRPVVPGAVDYGSAIGDAIQSNIKNLPSLVELSKLSTAEMEKLLEQTMPGYSKLRDSTTGAIQNLVTGELTQAEQNSMRRTAAEMNWSGGTPNSDFGNYKELGLSFNRMQERTRFGLSSAANWLQTAKGSAFDFTKMFMGKDDAMRQADSTWSRDWLAAQVKAGPDPTVRGSVDMDNAMVGMVLGAYGGGAGYTNSYRPSYGGGAGGGSGAQNNSSFFGTGDAGSAGYGASEGGGNIGTNNNFYSGFSGAENVPGGIF